MSKQKITRIKPPKFRIGRQVLNEYELRNLMLDIAEGKFPQYVGKKIKDSLGGTAVFNMDGTLSGRIKGLHILSEYAIKLMNYKNKKRPF